MMSYKKVTKSIYVLCLLGAATLGLTSCDVGGISSGVTAVSLKVESTTPEKQETVGSENMQLTQAGYDLLCKHFRGTEMQDFKSKEEILNRFPDVINGVREHIAEVMEKNGDKLAQSEFDVLVSVFHGLKNWGPTNFWKEASFVKALQSSQLSKTDKRRLAAGLLFLFVMGGEENKEVIPGLAKRKTAESNILVALVAAQTVMSAAEQRPTVHESTKSFTEQLGIRLEDFPSYKEKLLLANNRWKIFVDNNEERKSQGKTDLLEEAEKIYKAYWTSLASEEGAKLWQPQQVEKEELLEIQQ